MLDNKIYTFLKLCELMNYRKTAEFLNMTQPAVTQHIHALENFYNCKLFIYEGKTLYKTEKALELETHTRSLVYNEIKFETEFNHPRKNKISIGATKTIGDYIINSLALKLLQDENTELNLIIDNTKNLFEQLNSFELDFLMIEGYFDKNKYNHQTLREEELLGICSEQHKFANKVVDIDEIFNEHIILREIGSGTRDVFEHFLKDKNYSFEQFKKISTISSFKIIQEAVENNIGISFVYETIPLQNKNLATFKIKNCKIFHELNYVFLKNTINFNSILEKFKLI